MKFIKKLFALILVLATALSLFAVPAAALDNTSSFALKITSPDDNTVDIDPTKALKIKWKRYGGARFYWVAIRDEDGNYIYNGEVHSTSLTIKDSLEYSTNYKVFVEARDDRGERMHSGRAWQVHYFSTCDKDSPCGLLDGFPELLLDHGKYNRVDNMTYYSIVDEYIDSNKKLRLEWICSEYDIIDYIQIFVKQLDGDPDPEHSYDESGTVLYSKETSRDYLTISKSKVRKADQCWIKVSLQGCTESGDAYTSIRNYYLWIGDPTEKDKAEETRASYPTYSDGNKYAAYEGTDYLTELYKLYSDGDISEVEYKNRVSVCENARYMTSILWTSPVDFHTWRGSKLYYNSNREMLHSGSDTNVYEFSAGNVYKGIPYCAHAGNNKMGVIEWVDKLASVTERSNLEGTADYLDILRSNCSIYGIDCSGFIYKTYSNLNKPAPHLSTSDMIDDDRWIKISKSELMPGDILLKKGHVMVFVGKVGDEFAVFESVADGENGCSGCRYYLHTCDSVRAYTAYRYKYIDK